MRLLHRFDSHDHARAFAQHLQQAGIASEARQAQQGGWNLFVIDEKAVRSAKEALDTYLRNPQPILRESVPPSTASPTVIEVAEDGSFSTRPRSSPSSSWSDAPPRLAGRDSLPPPSRDSSRYRNVDVGRNWRRRLRGGPKPYTYLLMGACCLVAFLTRLGDERSAVEALTITSYDIVAGHVRWKGLDEIAQGEVWRLITPIFLHFGILHLIFNLLWLRDLGGMVESVHSGWYLFLFVALVGILSNLGQYWLGGYPVFGGMSGVIYALLGYVWLRGRLDPASGLFLSRETFLFMGFWFLLCLSGVVGRVANAAHGVGLASGLIWGYLSSKPWRRWGR